MTLTEKIVSLIDEGYEIRFMGDDICRGLRIRVSKSIFRVETFIGYDELCTSMTGSEFLILYTISMLVDKLDKTMKG